MKPHLTAEIHLTEEDLHTLIVGLMHRWATEPSKLRTLIDRLMKVQTKLQIQMEKDEEANLPNLNPKVPIPESKLVETHTFRCHHCGEVTESNVYR